MKKVIKNLMLASIATLGMASCSDVPSPFQDPNEGVGGEVGGGETTLPEGVYIQESFATEFGTFEAKTIKGIDWVIDYSCAKATGYANGSTTASEAYLVSQAVDLTDSKEAYITFQYILRYATNNGNAKPGVENKVLITNNYTGDPATTTWTDITGTLVEGSDWNTWYTFNANVPADMLGKDKVVLALYYACAENSATWEVKELKMADGKAEEEEPSEVLNTPIVPEEGNLLVNGNFEGWTDNLPTHWKSSCTASSASLSPSTDAHSGSYSVLVKGEAQNKRLAYEEMSLKAGDYTMSFFAKAVEGEASVRPGYAVVEGGSLSGDSYKYADYVNGITNAEWVEVTHSFTLEADAVVCLLVMNPKSTATDVLIDDFKLTSSNGGTEEGGEGETPAEGAEGDGSLENPFNALAAYNYAAALAADQATSEKFYVKGIVCESSKWDINTTYKNATFHISVDGTAATQQFLIFRTKGLNGADITSVDDVQVGDEVVIYASLVNYKGNTPETAQGGIIYSQKRNGEDLNPGTGGNEGEGEGEGNGEGNGGATEGEDGTVLASSWGLPDTEELSTLNMPDGISTLTFDLGGGRTTPKYYNTGKAFRMYPKNTLKVDATKTIKEITLVVDVYNGTTYNASGDVSAEPGTVTIAEEVITISDINSTSTLISNTSTQSGGASQIRMKSIRITYAD